MSVRFASVSILPTFGNLIAQATETIFMTVGPLSPPVDNAQVILFWSFAYLVGTGWTNAGIRLRRGSTLASTLINQTVAETVTPGNNVQRGGVYVDSPGPAGGLLYSLSINVTGGSASGTCLDGCLLAVCL